MNILMVILFITFLFVGGFLGIRRLSYAIVIILAGFIAFITYHYTHVPLTQSVMLFGLTTAHAFLISLFAVIFVPFFVCMFIFSKIVNRLGINEYAEYGYYDSGISIIDKIFGAGLSGLIYVILHTIFVR